MALIDSIVNMGHHSVLEHIEVTFGIDGISRACSHQLVRHRIASFSQQSQRYVNLNKDMSIKFVTPPAIKKLEDMNKDYEIFLFEASKFYNYLIDNGCEPEDARFVLPNACCTNIVMTVNARELIEMCKVRLCSTSQWEIKSLFDSIKNLINNNNKLAFLSKYLKPKCDWVDFCSEDKRCCGRHKTRETIKNERTKPE